MAAYNISRNDDKPTKAHLLGLSAVLVARFLLRVKAPYLYSVGEYDEDDNHVERLNGEEWLAANPAAREEAS